MMSETSDEPDSKRLKTDPECEITSDIAECFQLISSNDVNDSCNDSTEGLSKRQKKRLLKREKWLAKKPEKRAKEKEKLKTRREEARRNNIDLGPSRAKLRNNKMSASKRDVHVVLDFSFEELMSDKDLVKCVNQLLRCYSTNRRSKDPLQLHVVNFKGKTKDHMSKHTGYVNWDVFFHDETYSDIFDKDKLVYLTSDSDNVVDVLEDGKVYIIGALVDHNSQKGLCLKIAQDQGIAHGRLPIGENLEMKTRQVLAVNHVFEILCNVFNGLDWKEALLKVIPQRKGATEKPTETNSRSELEV